MNKMIGFLLLTVAVSTVHSAALVVNTVRLDIPAADDGLCMLSEAIAAANTNIASGSMPGECIAGEPHPVVDVIEFDVSILPAYFATFESYTLTESIHIKGPAKELLFFGGIALNRVFHVFNTVVDAEFYFSDMTFAYSAIRLPFDDYGGAVLATHSNGASLQFERVDFIGNNAERGGGALGFFGGSNNSTLIKDCLFDGNFVYANNEVVAGGGAIFIGANQSVEIQNSTFVNNSATNLPGKHPLDDAAGGAILMRANGASFTSDLTIEHSTFSDNTADGVGGALAFGGPAFAADTSVVTIKHSTVIFNQADFNDNQTGPDSGGGGFYSSSTTAANLFNSIMAANRDNAASPAPDLTGAIISAGYNLIGNNRNASGPFPAGEPNANQDLVGSLGQIIIPLVNSLADNGGPTPTHMPQSGSPAIDQGKCNVVTTDQRHQHNDQSMLRTIDQPTVANALTGCDMGAVERGSTYSNAAPEVTADSYTLLEGELLEVNPNLGLLSNDNDNDDLIITSAGSFNTSKTDTTGAIELWANGYFTFQADDPDAFGETSFEYTASDLLNNSTATVTLITEPVNDPPSFDVVNTTLVGQADSYSTFPNWAQNISAGPANEANQAVVFAVQITNAPNDYFAGFPAIDPITGDLSFALSATARGSAEFNLTLQDNGGTANGGNHISLPLLIAVVSSDVIFTDNFE